MDNNVNSVLEELLNSMNLNMQNVSEGENIKLTFDSIGDVYFIENESALCIYHHPNIDESMNAHYLDDMYKLCHPEFAGEYDIQCGLSSDDKIFAKYTLDKTTLTLQECEQILENILSINTKII